MTPPHKKKKNQEMKLYHQRRAQELNMMAAHSLMWLRQEEYE